MCRGEQRGESVHVEVRGERRGIKQDCVCLSSLQSTLCAHRLLFSSPSLVKLFYRDNVKVAAPIVFVLLVFGAGRPMKGVKVIFQALHACVGLVTHGALVHFDLLTTASKVIQHGANVNSFVVATLHIQIV